MPITARNILKQYFETGKKPTQAQFANLIDTFFHKSEDTVTIANVSNLAAVLASKASTSQIATILNALGALEDLQTSEKTSIVAAINELKSLIGAGGGLNPDVFESNFTVSLSGGKFFFKWGNGQNVPAEGKTAIELMLIGAQEAIAPTANLSLSASSITYNKKTDVDLNVNYSYAINSLGATLVNLKLERSRDGVAWTELINSATPPASPFVDTDINGGAVNNSTIYYRLTIEDSEGLIVNNTKQANFVYRSFLGYASSAPADVAAIVALGNSALSGKARTVSNVTAGAGQYTWFAYRASDGDLSGVVMDGSAPILGAFTKVGDLTGADEFGGAVTYRIYRSNATQAFINNTLAFN
jgi:hypothetical protein